IIEIIYITISKGHKVFICGNGGSAADAQHLSAEFLVRLKPKNNRKAYPLISLALDTSTITACGNDYGFENIFSRNLSALAIKNDILIIISTSGNSKNILKVLNMAKKMSVKTVGFLGNNGGKARTKVDIPLIVPSKNVARIQETHIFLGHFILEQVEKKLLKKKV
ncbi:MAG: SIS domain-containing protein, partial [Pelagibacterales bacterium]|nr:SIS domain-containing protein [Pelagibacterales bacterium]